MAIRFVVSACALLVILAQVLGQETRLQLGMDEASKAYDAVCWYESLKVFPNTNASHYSWCKGQMSFQENLVLTTNKEYFAAYPDKKETAFGEWNEQNMNTEKIPAQYIKNCGPLLKTPQAAPASDESDALNDGQNEYPYRAFAYCMMSTLRETHGEKAIAAVKGEITHFTKGWMDTLVIRDNEFRARHGSPALQLASNLIPGAQQWAEKIARECRMYHSDASMRQFNGGPLGENIYEGYETNKANAAYEASDKWYEEIKDYPYPQGFDGQDEVLFHKIGHFTQSVWKETEYVGYGIAINPDCEAKGAGTTYIVGRYYPPGNYPSLEKHIKNVLPPKD